jgi:hypothetical protein
MAELHLLLVLIVFLGPIGMVAYMLRSKLGLTRPVSTEFGPARRGEVQRPPLLVVLTWLAALIALILLHVRG